MEPRKQGPEDQGDSGSPREYEAPGVDEVLSADDLAREIHYAGTIGSGGPG